MPDPTPDHPKRQLIAAILGELNHQSGRSYRIDLEPLSIEALQALLGALRDIDPEKRRAVSRARVFPWQGH